jgi:hypothetical protein
LPMHASKSFITNTLRSNFSLDSSEADTWIVSRKNGGPQLGSVSFTAGRLTRVERFWPYNAGQDKTDLMLSAVEALESLDDEYGRRCVVERLPRTPNYPLENGVRIACGNHVVRLSARKSKNASAVFISEVWE